MRASGAKESGEELKGQMLALKDEAKAFKAELRDAFKSPKDFARFIRGIGRRGALRVKKFGYDFVQTARSEHTVANALAPPEEDVLGDSLQDEQIIHIFWTLVLAELCMINLLSENSSSFKDLREVLYRRRLRAAKRLEEHWATAPENRGPDAPAVPRQNQLRVLRTNYRCHQGVLSVANLCLEMMQLFPDSVDAIAAEQAHFAGKVPLLFLDDQFDEVAECFSGGAAMSEFGANQVIIVRNDEAKRSLPSDANY